jgi:hypothetical protein
MMNEPDVMAELAELRAFKAEWEPVLVQMVPALVSIVRLATSLMPPGMQSMIPPQVLSFQLAAEKKAS